MLQCLLHDVGHLCEFYTVRSIILSRDANCGQLWAIVHNTNGKTWFTECLYKQMKYKYTSRLNVKVCTLTELT